MREIGLQSNTKAYIQSIVLKKTLEAVSFERRRGVEENDNHDSIERILERLKGCTEVPDVTTQQ